MTRSEPPVGTPVSTMRRGSVVRWLLGTALLLTIGRLDFATPASGHPPPGSIGAAGFEPLPVMRAQARSRSVVPKDEVVPPPSPDALPRALEPGAAPPEAVKPGIIRKIPVPAQPEPTTRPADPGARSRPIGEPERIERKIVPFKITDPKAGDPPTAKKILQPPTTGIVVRRIVVPDAPGAEPVDTRVEVTRADLDGLPFSAIGQLTVRFPSGVVQTGSGFFIAPGVVLTAAHVLYSHQYGAGVSVTFTSNCRKGAGGGDVVRAQTVERANFRVSDRWARGDKSIVGDYGALFLPEAPWHTVCGILAARPIEPTFVDRHVTRGTADFIVAGYPADKPFGTLWMARGILLASPAIAIRHLVDTMRGQSGAPMIVVLNDPETGRKVAHAVAIHSREGAYALNYNVARRIEREMLADIRRWHEAVSGER